MTPREYDESDARIRPSRTTRRRTKDRPTHSDSITAFVTTVDRGRTTCVTDDGVIITAMKARELGPKSVVVGDLVEIVGDVSGTEGSLARIVVVNERTNSLSRTVDDAARVERTIVANIDQLLIVVASANPEPRRGLIDRFLVSAFHESIKPIIVVTKVDVSPVPDFIQEYKALGVEIFTTSSKLEGRKEDIDKLLEILDDKISVLVGHSGVGKSTLINELVPNADRMTGDVNDVTGRGRHTSSSAIALPLANGGWIIDTPGIRAFGLSHLNRERIIESFPDIYQVIQRCMPNCSHHENSCALGPWIESEPEFRAERLTRVTSLRSLLEVKPVESDAPEDGRYTHAMSHSRGEDLALAHRLADAADAITLTRYQALDLTVTTKPDNTPVTDADKSAESAIRALLHAHRPDDGIVGEEFGNEGLEKQRYWVIDPIDGTKNFLRGVPTWATLIALVEKSANGDQKVTVGVVSAPALFRRWYAHEGAGAFVVVNSEIPKKISVSKVSKMEDASVSHSDFIGWGDRLGAFNSLLSSAWRTRAHGDFWSHMLVAEGAVDVAVEPELALWDMAALDIIVREAGGRFTNLDGVDGIHGGNGLSTNSALHSFVVEALRVKG